jgi:outer membrane protein assembly factor BamD
MDRALDAKARLEALHQPVPRPTRAALDLNKKEVASRHETGAVSSLMGNFEKHPDVAKASHLGDPTMVDPPPTNPGGVIRDVMRAGGIAGGGDEKVGAETTNGKVVPNQPAPRSDAPPTAPDTAVATVPGEPASAPDPAAAAAELKPNVADPNELKPNVEQDPNALPPLQQSNQLDSSGASTGTSTTASAAAPAKDEEMADISSSKKKKKKGVAKLNPF